MLSGSDVRMDSCTKRAHSKLPRKTLLVLCLVIVSCVYVFKDIIHRGRVFYGISHMMEKVDCSNIGYRNFRYYSSLPSELQAWNDTHSDTIKTDPQYQVPNIVHYIWYSDQPKEFKFHHMLSVKSAIKFIKPDVVFIHLNTYPMGDYWEMVVNLPEVKIIRRDPTLCIAENQLTTALYETSGSNVDRLVVLAEMGGIYLDFDTIAIRSFDELRKYPCTLGVETAGKFCGAVIVCSKESLFLNMWLNSYIDDYRIFTWAYNSGKFPYVMWQRYPHLLHTEPTKLVRPNGDEYKQIWGDEKYPWWENYCIHLWYRKWHSSLVPGKEPTFENIKTWNSTFGAIARNVLLDSYELVTSS